MKQSSILLILALIVSAFSLTACDRDEPAEEPAEEPAVEEEEEEAREYDENMFMLAAFEVNCVNAHIDDPADAGAIKEEIYARYGFEDQADFRAAEAQLGESESVRAGIEARMERCNEELARGLREAGYEFTEEEEEEAEEEAAAEERPRPAPRPQPARTGSMSGSVSGADFSNATVSLNVRADFNLRGAFQGEREGRAFNVPFNGRVAEDGTITASGSRAGNSVTVTGRLTSAGANGTVSGTINQRDFNRPYRAN